MVRIKLFALKTLMHLAALTFAQAFKSLDVFVCDLAVAPFGD